MSTERRQTIEDVEKEQRVLEDRRKLIDDVKNERNGYLFRNTKIPRYVALASVVIFILCTAGFLLNCHIQKEFLSAPYYGSVEMFKNDFYWIEIPHKILKYFMISSLLSGLIGSAVYLFTKNKNKIEFQAELEQNDKMLDLMKKYRADDTLEKSSERRKAIDSVKKDQRKLADRRKSLNSATNVRDGYLYRDTVIPYNTMVLSCVFLVISLVLFLVYQQTEVPNAYKNIGDTQASVDLINTIILSVLVLSSTIVTISASAYFYLKERNKKEFSEELDLCEKNIRLIKNHREDDEATKEE